MSNIPPISADDARTVATVPEEEAGERALRLMADQRERWKAGETIPVEAYLEQQPELQTDRAFIINLIHNEFLLREQRGEKPNIQEYIARFPQFEKELAQPSAATDTCQWNTVAQAPANSINLDREMARALKAPFVQIPGYEILRELGRGGMGVVYLAKQTSLNRKVALKMVLGGDFARNEDLARFRAEAETVAHLQHPNIVQVHEIGEHDGRPFFSLEFVDGGSLAERLNGFPQPPQASAIFIEILARAIHFAHERGIVHRDLKPANILLRSGVSSATLEIRKDGKADTNAEYGLPKITDFGLAKWLNSDSHLTQSGDILGTPSYMAPEQAAGRIQAIGPATDVYALGAILYQFLTGRPPFRGANLTETLLQVQNSEPVPPTRLQPSAPVDLETICLKCLEKEPGKRYSSAEALADDLNRFQTGLPILARPVGSWQRLRKWAHRHPMVAFLLGVIVLAVLLFCVGAVWTNISLRAAAAREALKHQESERHFQQALEAVDQMLNEVGEVDLENVPRMVPAREKLLLRAQNFYDKFLQERDTDPAVRRGAGRTQLGLGDIHAYSGNQAKAEICFRQAIDLFGSLVSQFPGRSDYRQNLGRAYHTLADLLRKNKQYDDAKQTFAEALRLRRQLADENPDDPECERDVAASEYFQSVLLEKMAQNVSQKIAAQHAYRHCQELQKKLIERYPGQTHYKGDLARTLNQLGILLHYTNQPGAEQSITEAVALQAELVKEFHHETGQRQKLARYYNNLARHQLDRRAPDKAETSYRSALSLLDMLADDFPEVPEYRQELGSTYNNIGMLLRDKGMLVRAKSPSAAEKSLHDAETAFRSALALRRKLSAHRDDRNKLAETLDYLGFLLTTSGRPVEAAPLYREAIEIHGDLVNKYPQEARYRSSLGSASQNLGRLLLNQSRWTDPCQVTSLVAAGSEGHCLSALAPILQNQIKLCEGHRLLDQAIRQHSEALIVNPKNQDYRNHLLNDHWVQAEILLHLGGYHVAAIQAEKLPKLFPDHRDACIYLAKILALSWGIAERDLPPQEERTTKLLEAWSLRMVQLLDRACDLGCDSKTLQNPIFRPLKNRDDYKKLLRRAS